MSSEIRHLYVTLKRGFAGTRDTHIKILQSLGLRKREQTVQHSNHPSVRGALDKVGVAHTLRPLWFLSPGIEEYATRQVKHLVLVETDQARAARLLVEAELKAPRAPVTVQHSAVHR